MGVAQILAILTQAQAGIQSARLLIDLINEQIQLAKQNGQLTPEQIDLIEHQQRLSEQQWDEAVAAAKKRLATLSDAPRDV